MLDRSYDAYMSFFSRCNKYKTSLSSYKVR